MEIKEFQQKLQDIQRLAVNNGRKISREVVEDFFAGDGLNETQLQKVYDYLTIQGIHTDEQKKKTEKVSNDRYKITLYYDKDDETELLIRVLAFGPVMKVTEPESFIEQIKQRLRMQNN